MKNWIRTLIVILLIGLLGFLIVSALTTGKPIPPNGYTKIGLALTGILGGIAWLWSGK